MNHVTQLFVFVGPISISHKIVRMWEPCFSIYKANLTVLMVFVLDELAVTAGKKVTGHTEKFQWLLLVNVTELWSQK